MQQRISFVCNFCVVMEECLKTRASSKTEKAAVLQEKKCIVLRSTCFVESLQKLSLPQPFLLKVLLYYRFKTQINPSCSLLTIELVYIAMAF